MTDWDKQYPALDASEAADMLPGDGFMAHISVGRCAAIRAMSSCFRYDVRACRRIAWDPPCCSAGQSSIVRTVTHMPRARSTPASGRMRTV